MGRVWLMCGRCLGKYGLVVIVILGLVRGDVAGNEDEVLSLVLKMFWLMILCAVVRKHLVCWLLNLVLHMNGGMIR